MSETRFLHPASVQSVSASEDLLVASSERALVFVYGTLMPGERRWPVLSPYALSWDAATASGHLWDTGNGYPAATFDDDRSEIPGVAVVLPTDILHEVIRVLDEIEVEGVLYRRVAVPTSRGVALSYEWLGPTDRLLAVRGGWRGRPARG